MIAAPAVVVIAGAGAAGAVADLVVAVDVAAVVEARGAVAAVLAVVAGDTRSNNY